MGLHEGTRQRRRRGRRQFLTGVLARGSRSRFRPGPEPRSDNHHVPGRRIGSRTECSPGRPEPSRRSRTTKASFTSIVLFPADRSITHTGPKSAGKFVVPDGNSEIFDVSGGTLAINKEQVGATLTVDGGQAGSIDNFELVQNANGSIDVTLDSQTVYFDPGVIAKIVVNTESSLTLVSLEGTWNGSTSVVVNVDAQSPVDIFAAPDSKDIAANFSNMSVQVNDPRDESNLFFESTSSAYEENWGISSGNYSVSGNLGNNNLNIDYSFGHAASVNVDAGTIENDVDIENATCPINVALGGAANFVQLSLGQQNLGYEFTSPISITGQIETLQFYDQSDIAPRTVNIDDGEFYLAGEPVVHFQAVDAITYYAGWGPDVINVAPGSENLSDVAPIVWVHGANNRSDTLNVFDNDSSSAAGNQYTVTHQGRKASSREPSVSRRLRNRKRSITWTSTAPSRSTPITTALRSTSKRPHLRNP